jgi:hypothetical protein
MDLKEIKAEKAEMKHGILHMVHSPKAVIDLFDMKRIISVQKQIAGQERYGLLVDLRGGVIVTEAAAALVANNPNFEQIRGVAMVVDKHILDFMKAHVLGSKPNVVTEVFDDEKAARDWLKTAG